MMHYYQHNIGDYARDTSHLTVIEHGIYRLLLDWYYLNEKPITTEKALRLGRGYPNETQSVLSEFFSVSDEGWRHCRVEAELELYRKKAETNRENGLKGGRPKTQNNPVGSQSGGEQNPAVTLTNNQEPITILKTEIKVSCPADAEPVTTKTRFGEFWAAYPDKTGKKPSFEKWKAKRLDAIADKIVSDVNGRKARDRKWLDGFIPNPLTYLNQERWNDPIQEARPVQQQIRPMSKQEQGMAALMELRNEFMAGERDNRGRNETVRPLLGRDPIGDDDSGDGDGLDRDD